MTRTPLILSAPILKAAVEARPAPVARLRALRAVQALRVDLIATQARQALRPATTCPRFTFTPRAALRRLQAPAVHTLRLLRAVQARTARQVATWTWINRPSSAGCREIPIDPHT